MLTDDAKLVVDHALPAANRSIPEDAAVRIAQAIIAAADEPDDGCEYCGTDSHDCGVVGSMRTNHCRDRQIARLQAKLATVTEEQDTYRELLPLPREQWRLPITAEICDRLGMCLHSDAERRATPHIEADYRASVCDGETEVIVTLWSNGDSPTVEIADCTRATEFINVTKTVDGCESFLTAGQLMFLVAARRLR